jgi:eukaryotic-like serine/threonine-protein kinase
MHDMSRHLKVTATFGEALALPVEQRRQFVNEACDGDDAMCMELLSLLDAHDASTSYFDRLSEELIQPVVASLPISGGTAQREDLIPELQQALGDAYLVERELPGGGMSRVFLAEERSLARRVVVKVLPASMARGLSAASFQREIQLLAKLQHPHIVPVLASNAAGTLAYYTMPFVAGESLRARLAKQDQLPISEAIAIWRSVLDALSHAHAHAVVHRDIKPDNILLSGRSAVVADFGIAVAVAAAADTHDGAADESTGGTPTYIAPELLTGGHADHRSDIYGAGLVMYEMLEGHRPFGGITTRERLSSRAGDTPSMSRADVPAALSRLVLQCLALDPGHRPQSADQVLEQLEQAAADTPRRAERKRRWPVPAGLLLLISAALLGSIFRDRFSPGAFADVRQSDTRPSLAVLHLQLPDTDSATAYRADVLTGALMEKLSAAGTLRVIQGPSVGYFKGHNTAPHVIADSLGVDNVLVGAVNREGKVERVRFQLIRRDGSVRWVQSYLQDTNGMYALEDSIHRAVGRELLPQYSAALPRRRGPGPAAYELYQRGRYEESHQERQGTLLAAIRLYSQAVDADSTYAEAYAALAIAYAFIATGNVSDFPYQSAVDSARYFASRAIALDDSIAEAYEARAFVKVLHDLDLSGAEADRARAIAVNPYYHRRVHVGVAIHQWRGNYAAAVDDIRLTLASDPMSPNTRGELARTLFFDSKIDAALAQLDSARAINGGRDLPRLHLTHGEILLHQKRYDEAIAQFERMRSAAPESPAPRAFLAVAHARAGNRDSANHFLNDLQERWKSGRASAFYVALAYAGLHDYDNAFRWLDGAYADRSLRPLIMDPTFRELRQDKRFDVLLRRVGLKN